MKAIVLKREGGTFHFEDGTVMFYGPVHGHGAGAVFTGKGFFTLTPGEKSEQRSPALLTKSKEGMHQEFTTVVLRFIDGTAEELKAGPGGIGNASALQARCRLRLS